MIAPFKRVDELEPGAAFAVGDFILLNRFRQRMLNQALSLWNRARIITCSAKHFGPVG
jgi:hypothetical protein